MTAGAMETAQVRDVIKEITDANRVELVGDIVASQECRGKYFQYVKVPANSPRLKCITTSILHEMTKAATGRGVDVTFIFIPRELSEASNALRVSLRSKFTEAGLNCDIVDSVGGVVVIVTYQNSNIERDRIEDHILAFLDGIGERLRSISFISGDNLPGAIAVLRVIRVASPLSGEDIQEILQKRNFIVPTFQWLNRMLDGLRKRGLVVRREDGQYILAYQAIKLLGTERGRRSPDIIRGLALAKRLL